MNLSFLAITYFQKLAKEQHLTRTAEELHISQPALSKMLSSLEKEAGVPLFDRVGRNITLNNYGKIFLKYADRISQNVEDLERELEEQKEKEHKTISLSLQVASSLIPALLMNFSRVHPTVHYRILQQDDDLPGESDMTPSPDADLTIFSNTYPIENDHTVTLLKEDLLLAMPSEKTDSEIRPVHLSDFSDAEFICLQKGKSLRTITDFYCRMAGFSPNIILESDSPQTVRAFIRAGIGVSLVPEITWRNVRADKLILCPIASPQCTRYISLAWNESRFLSPAAASLKEYLIEHFKEMALKI